jgi:hypothetical protein
MVPLSNQVTTLNHKRFKGSRQRRRALKLLTGSTDGCTEAILLAHGFTVDMLAGLIRAGLATAQAERMSIRLIFRLSDLRSSNW